MPTRRRWLLWPLIFLLGALIAPVSFWLQLERDLGVLLKPLAGRLPVIQFIWIVGGVPVTFILLVWATWRGSRRRRLALWCGYLGGSVIELLAKHWIHTPLPTPSAEPLWLIRLGNDTNIGPSQVGAWLHALHPRSSSNAANALLHGSYPSGHTFRITYLSAIWLGLRRWRWVVLIAMITAVCVVATGGHWIGDAVGGFSLAMTISGPLLAVPQRVPTEPGGRTLRTLQPESPSLPPDD